MGRCAIKTWRRALEMRRRALQMRRCAEMGGVAPSKWGAAQYKCGVALSKCGVAPSERGAAPSKCGVAPPKCGVALSKCGVAQSKCGVAAPSEWRVATRKQILQWAPIVERRGAVGCCSLCVCRHPPQRRAAATMTPPRLLGQQVVQPMRFTANNHTLQHRMHISAGSSAKTTH